MLPLVVTNTHDSHADLLLQEFNKRGVACHRFNTDVLGTYGTLSWNGDDLSVAEFNRTTFASQVSSVAWRRPGHPESPLLQAMSESSLRFAQEEMFLALQGTLRASIPADALWVSHPDDIQRANFRPVQLATARALGFHVPKTLITNNPVAARQFADSLDWRVVAKVVGRGPAGLSAGKALYTVDLESKRANLTDEIMEGLRFSPVLFQERIPKSHEIRATFIGGKSFVARLLSQEVASCREDWRRFSTNPEGVPELPHEPACLPPNLESRCLRMMRCWRLNLSCFDFIVDPAGDFFFLENNVNGQFLWIQDYIPEFKMVEEWADLLTGAGVPIAREVQA